MNEIKGSPLENWKVGEHIPALLTWVSNKVSADGSQIYKHHFKLGIVDWRVIAYLGVFSSGTNNQICSYIGLDKSAVSRSISHLQALNLVTTRSLDGRTTELKLSPEGLRIGNEMLAFAQQIENELIHGLSAEELAAFKGTLQKLLDNLPRVRNLRPA